MPSSYRIGVIGSTGRGNYGHGLDQVWRDVAGTQIVAVADDDEKGLADALPRLDCDRGFADWRRMIDEAKPDIVAICPRWLDRHAEMAIAAAQRGIHIYLEKPFCRTLEEADAVVEAVTKHNVKLALAYQTRYSPKLPVVEELIVSGGIGQLLELRGRGKEDRRGGGEDLWVLGAHIMNLIHHFGGEPVWCFARIEEDGEPVTSKHIEQGAEGIGPLAGDNVRAMYGMPGGVTAYFNSVRATGSGATRFGLQIFGSQGVIEVITGHLSPMNYLSDVLWSPGRSGKQWVPITSAGVGKPEPLKDGGLHAGNILAVRDLLDAIQQDRQPEANVFEARTATEMIIAVFESHRVGGPVKFPLSNRRNPLTML